MDPKLKLVSVTVALTVAIFVINAVRSRKLREEYSFLWLLIAAVLVINAVWQTPLAALTRALGGILPVNILFFAGLMFLVVASLFYSIRISALDNQVKELAQELALLRHRVESEPRETPAP